MAEAVDPIILNMKLVDVCQCRPCDCSLTEIPQAILDCFGDSLTQGGDVHRLYVTLGQFSIIRLERDTQLLMPVYDYCMPEKECDCGSDCSQEDPCEVFRQVKFPVDEFFPPNSSCSRNCSRPCGFLPEDTAYEHNKCTCAQESIGIGQHGNNCLSAQRKIKHHTADNKCDNVCQSVNPFLIRIFINILNINIICKRSCYIDKL